MGCDSQTGIQLIVVVPVLVRWHACSRQCCVVLGSRVTTHSNGLKAKESKTRNITVLGSAAARVKNTGTRETKKTLCWSFTIVGLDCCLHVRGM